MVDVVRNGSGYAASRRTERVNWRKAMSDNIAYALLVYTGLQIFVTMRAIEGNTGSTMPLLALVVLVAAIIPLCRRFERRWEAMTEEACCDPALRGTYRRDQAMLWTLAIGLPFVLTGVFRAIASLT